MRILSSLLVCCFCILACKEKVLTIKPEIRNISESVYASGIIKSGGQHQVMSLVTGRIEKIFTETGASVKKGDPLFKIYNEVAGINTNISKLSAEQAAYKANTDKITDIVLQIGLTKKKLANDSIMMVRQRNLWAQNIGTKTELEQRELAYESSLSNLKSMNIQLSELRRQLKYADAQSKMNLAATNEFQKEYTIRSESDGTVFSVLKEKGEMIGPQTVLAVIGDTKVFEVELMVDEYDIVRIKPGQQVIFSLDSYKGKVFQGKVKSIDPIMEERTRTFKVNAVFDVLPEVIYPNLSAEANIIILSKENVMTIPRNCLLPDSTVMLKDGSLRKLEIGLQDYKIVEVLSGIDLTTEIIKPN
ncbi:MAG: efflux RND transporter periplasmic adaptor subunit [Saprospiraceae bacterium]|nr:efflux RND transporter periplasmic adaptor subunit [Saprospiraceae bacterium]